MKKDDKIVVKSIIGNNKDKKRFIGKKGIVLSTQGNYVTVKLKNFTSPEIEFHKNELKLDEINIMKKSELRQIIKEEIKSILKERGTDWGDEQRQQARDDAAYKKSHQKFKDRERNAGVEDEDPDQQRDMVRRLKGKYVKVGKSYIPALYHTPSLGRTDGKYYLRNKKTGGYFPVKK